MLRDYYHYHNTWLHQDDVVRIRTSLLSWYDSHRRRLPWRGDVGPYNGSTATSATAAKKVKVCSGGFDRS